MSKQTKLRRHYLAPACKVVELNLRSGLMQPTSGGIEKMDVQEQIDGDSGYNGIGSKGWI